jgi:hypothetical protein
MSHNDGLARRLRAALTSSQSSTTSAIKDRSDEITFTDDDPAPASGLKRWRPSVDMEDGYKFLGMTTENLDRWKDNYVLASEADAALAAKDRELHQARAEWQEEKKRALESEKDLAAERERADKMEYRHYCDRGHERIGLLDKDGPDDGCPLCAERERAERAFAQRDENAMHCSTQRKRAERAERRLTEAREALETIAANRQRAFDEPGAASVARAALARLDGKEEKP